MAATHDAVDGDGLSTGLSTEQKKQAVAWITSDPARLESLQEQSASVAPRGHRRPGWINDQANERDLLPLPLEDIAAPTVIAHGANDRVVPVEHAANAATEIPGAEMMLVEEGHHLLSLSRHYGPVASTSAGAGPQVAGRPRDACPPDATSLSRSNRTPGRPRDRPTGGCSSCRSESAPR